MIKISRILASVALAVTGIVCAEGRELHLEGPAQDIIFIDRLAKGNKIQLDSTAISDELLRQRVIVGKDTVPVIIPEKNYGRYDRGLYNFLIIPRGQWSFGLTASYGEFDSKDVEVLSLVKNLDLKLKSYSLRPSIAYFFRNNQSIGITFNYVRTAADLNSLSIDIDDDMSFDLKDVSYYSNTYSAALAYRNYIGLGTMKRFAIFNEVNLEFGGGSSRFKRLYGGELRDTRTSITRAALNFSPGLCIFIMDYISFNVSFGVFGVTLRNEKQMTDGVDEGSRFTSGANFRFNIFNINFGMAVHI